MLELKNPVGKTMYYNFISQLNNANMAKKDFIEPVYSNLNYSLAEVLKEAGFINDAKVFKNSKESFKRIHIDLKYDNGLGAFEKIQPVSTPSLRKYKKAKDLTLIRGGRGSFLISTSKGILTGKKAMEKGLGGEVICLIY